METELQQAASSTGSSTTSSTGSSISQQMLNSAMYAYSNNNTGYLWNSTQSMTA
jgi:hypothetical protein